MHATTTRTIIAAAALAAAGFIALPDQATPQQATTQQATVSRQLALVDTETDVVGTEIQIDNDFWNAVLGPTGAEEQLYNALGASAPTLLDTTGAEPPFSGVFDGAESRFTEALFVEFLYADDQLNKLLGISDATSQAALANDLNIESVPIPSSLGADFSVDPGATFDSSLLELANADFSLGSSDLLGYLAAEASALGLGGLF